MFEKKQTKYKLKERTILFKEIPSENYDKYQHLFAQEHCNQTFVDSAFTYKHVRLKVDDIEKPTMAYLDYKYAIIIVGDPETLTDEEFLDLVKEHVVFVVDKEKWLPRLLEHLKGRLIERRRTKLLIDYCFHQNQSQISVCISKLSFEFR